MRRPTFLIGLALCACAATSQATTVTAYAALHGGARATRVGTTAISLNLSGPSSPFDVGIDEAEARASIGAGALRILAREGGDTGNLGGRFGAIAGATLREGVTIGGTGTQRVPITIAYSVNATPDTLLIDTGNALGPGRGEAEIFGSFAVETTFRGTNGFTRTERGSARFSQITGHDFVPLSQSVHGTATPVGPVLTMSDDISVDRLFTPIERILDVRTITTSNAVNAFGMDFEVDILAAPGDHIVISAALEAEVDGPSGTFAAINALNSALISIDLPAGLDFTSDSGVFLTLPVPLPGSIVLLLPAITALAASARAQAPMRRT